MGLIDDDDDDDNDDDDDDDYDDDDDEDEDEDDDDDDADDDDDDDDGNETTYSTFLRTAEVISQTILVGVGKESLHDDTVNQGKCDHA